MIAHCSRAVSALLSLATVISWRHAITATVRPKPFDRLWLDCRWRSVAIVFGHHRSSSVATGRRQSLSTTICHHRSWSVIFGHHRSSSVIVHRRRPPSVSVGYCWIASARSSPYRSATRPAGDRRRRHRRRCSCCRAGCPRSAPCSCWRGRLATLPSPLPRRTPPAGRCALRPPPPRSSSSRTSALATASRTGRRRVAARTAASAARAGSRRGSARSSSSRRTGCSSSCSWRASGRRSTPAGCSGRRRSGRTTRPPAWWCAAVASTRRKWARRLSSSSPSEDRARRHAVIPLYCILFYLIVFVLYLFGQQQPMGCVPRTKRNIVMAINRNITVQTTNRTAMYVCPQKGRKTRTENGKCTRSLIIPDFHCCVTFTPSEVTRYAGHQSTTRDSGP